MINGQSTPSYLPTTYLPRDAVKLGSTTKQTGLGKQVSNVLTNISAMYAAIASQTWIKTACF